MDKLSISANIHPNDDTEVRIGPITEGSEKEDSFCLTFSTFYPSAHIYLGRADVVAINDLLTTWLAGDPTQTVRVDLGKARTSQRIQAAAAESVPAAEAV